jgi:hypothetical protein
VPGFFRVYCGDVLRVHPCGHPVGHSIIDQPMPVDVLQSIIPDVDRPDSKMTSASRSADVADVQMALILELDSSFWKGLLEALQQFIARKFYNVFFLHVFLFKDPAGLDLQLQIHEEKERAR